MKRGIQYTEKAVTEKKVKYPMGKICRTNVMPVSDEKQFSVEIKFCGFTVNLNIHLAGQVVAYPLVVIARKKMYGNSVVGQFGKLTKQSHKSAWDYVPVLEPEIEHITQQKNSCGVVFDGVEPVYKI